MNADPVSTNPHLYSVLFENERVRVLEYRDQPGERSVPHAHPDSVMITLSTFDRRLHSGEHSVDVTIPAETARWVGAQSHSGENTGSTQTHVIFVELKEPRVSAPLAQTLLGPTAS
ncbi:cytoplasmic protein [Nakamurella antarctica]|uniref:Cytoplasmic protein n=1 Tax=Nakamurella antarctica TaxID=1902245 RepID=A0A3G8ZTI2_9ACTN|nr:cytoplasmic protein [Nakamurella antarctica]AZI57111.1 cytoplasmic protein [Nakamurella antarctica]